MPDNVVSNDVLTGAAPVEGGVSTSHDYTDIIVWSGYKLDQALDALLSSKLEGCGKVDLVKIEVKIITSAEKQHVYMGFASTGSSIPVKMAAGKLSGLFFRSNAKTVGDEITKVLVPEDTLSRQIRPNSANLPMLKFMVDVTEGVDVFVHFYVKVSGMRVHYLN